MLEGDQTVPLRPSFVPSAWYTMVVHNDSDATRKSLRINGLEGDGKVASADEV